MVILTQDNLKFKIANPDDTSVGSLGFDTKINDRSKNGVANKTVTAELNKLIEEKNRIPSIVYPYYSSYSLKKQVDGYGTVFTPTSRSTEEHNKESFDYAYTHTLDDYNNAEVPNGANISYSSVTTSNGLSNQKSSGNVSLNVSSSSVDGKNNFTDTYSPAGTSKKRAQVLRRTYNVIEDQSFSSSDEIENCNYFGDSGFPIDSGYLQATLLINNDIRLDSTTFTYTLDLEDSTFSGALALSNGKLWYGTMLGASSSTDVYCTPVSSSADTQIAISKYLDATSPVLFLSKGVYSLTWNGTNWLFSDDSCIINAKLYTGTPTNPNLYESGFFKVYGSGIIEQHFWTRNLLTTNDQRIYLSRTSKINNYSSNNIPRMQFGANADASSSSSGLCYTTLENYNNSTAMSTTASIILGSCQNIVSGSAGSTQCWNYRNNGNGVTDWFFRGRID